MTSEMHFNIPEGSVLRRIDRYATEKVGIILDRHAPPPTGKLTKDPAGEWIKLKDIQVLLRMGGLLEASDELTERLLDGHAQQAFIRDVTNLGYTDFDQVMEILKNNRHQLLDIKEYEIWTEGYRATGEEQNASLLGKASGFSFKEACDAFHAQLDEPKKNIWSYHPDSGTWSVWGCRLFDNETDARKSFG